MSAFNIQTFVIPGMMPTTHPVAESITRTDHLGGVDLVFSESSTQPSRVSFIVTDYSGNRVIKDIPGDHYVRSGNNNKFVYGDPITGYLPVGTWFLWVLADGIQYKYTIVNTDNAFEYGAGSFIGTPIVEVPFQEESQMPGSYNFTPCVSGKPFLGLSLRITSGGHAPSVPIASATIRFRATRGSTGTPDLELSTVNSGIVVDNSSNWVLRIPQFTVTLAPGTYYYKLETTDTMGTTKDYVEGSWKIGKPNTAT